MLYRSRSRLRLRLNRSYSELFLMMNRAHQFGIDLNLKFDERIKFHRKTMNVLVQHIKFIECDFLNGKKCIYKECVTPKRYRNLNWFSSYSRKPLDKAECSSFIENRMLPHTHLCDISSCSFRGKNNICKSFQFCIQ